jgi:predicted DNA-binding protein
MTTPTASTIKIVSVVLPESEYETLQALADGRPLALYIRRLMENYINNHNRIDYTGKYKKLKGTSEEKTRVKVKMPEELKDTFFDLAESKGIMGTTLIRLLIQESAGNELPDYIVK